MKKADKWLEREEDNNIILLELLQATITNVNYHNVNYKTKARKNPKVLVKPPKVTLSAAHRNLLVTAKCFQR